MARLFRGWNGCASPESVEFCFVIADSENEAVDLARSFFWQMDLPNEPGRCRAYRCENPELEDKMQEIGRRCTMSENEKTIPVIPEGFPPADKADELTPQQLDQLNDKYGFTTREIAEMYDGLSWQKVARTVAKLRNPEGKTKEPRGKNKPQDNEPELETEVAAELTESVDTAPIPKKLRPTAFSGSALDYRVEGDNLVLRRMEGSEMHMPLSLLNVMISELQELSEVIEE